MDPKGSGYQNISVELCTRLSKLGHEIKILGYEYRGEEHSYPFSIIPSADFQAIIAGVSNLREMWRPDVVVSAFDVPIQKFLLTQEVFNGMKYIGIFPIESDPLILPYAMLLARMDAACVISKFGTEECKKYGLNAHYLEVGIDPEKWRQPTAIEREESRKALGVQDNYVVLTVADNQERKNLSRAMEMFAGFHKEHPESKYLLVTREHLTVGWDLRDYARVLGIGDSFFIFERGMPFTELWTIYAAADAFLLTSKAEGAALPLLEAMAVGVPCIGTNCTAIHEHLADGRGILIPSDYEIIDPFMNGKRYMASLPEGIYLMNALCEAPTLDVSSIREAAFKYVEQRSWDASADVLDGLAKKLGEKNEPSSK